MAAFRHWLLHGSHTGVDKQESRRVNAESGDSGLGSCFDASSRSAPVFIDG